MMACPVLYCRGYLRWVGIESEEGFKIEVYKCVSCGSIAEI